MVFTESFESTTLSAKPNAYLGGWFTPQVSPGEWCGATETSITTGTVQVLPTNGFRSAGVILGPSVFSGAGDYILSFDLATYSGDGNDLATVSVWSGAGYDLSGSTGNALILDTLSGSLTTSGAATATSLASISLTSAANAVELSFTYDGTSAVALFFGASTGGWPFPTARYDNIEIRSLSADPVPEPSAMMLGILTAGAALFRRRR